MQQLSDFPIEFFYNNPVSLTVNLIIVALLIIVILSLLRSYLNLRKEAEVLITLRDEIEALGKKTSLGRIWKVIQNLDPVSVIAVRMKHLYEIREKDGQLNIEMVNSIRENNPLPFPAFAKNLGGSFVLIGLIGTIIGLSLALGEMSSSVQELGASLGDLTEKLNGILAGMNTAFSTTATGLLATFVVLVLNYVYARQYDRMSEEIDTYFAKDILSLVQPIKPDNAMQRVVETLQENLKNSRVLSDRLVKTTDNATSQYDALLGVANSFEKGSQNIITHFDETTRVQQEIKALTERFTKIAANIDENAQAFSEKYIKIMQKMQSLVEHNSEYQIAIGNLVDDGQDNRQVLNQLTRQMSENTKEFTTINQSLKISINEIQVNYNKTNEQLNELLTNVINSIQETHAKTQEKIDKLMENLINDLNSGLQGLTQNLLTEIQTSAESQRDLNTELTTMVRMVLTNLEQATKVIKENTWGKPLHEAMVENSKNISTFGSAIEGFVGSSDGILNTLGQLDFVRTQQELSENTRAISALNQTMRRRGFVYRSRYLLSLIPGIRALDANFER